MYYQWAPDFAASPARRKRESHSRRVRGMSWAGQLPDGMQHSPVPGLLDFARCLTKVPLRASAGGASVCWRVRAGPAEHGEGAGAEKRGGGSVTLPRRASPTGSSPGGGGVAGGESDVPSPPKSGGRGRSSRRAGRPGGVSRERGGPGGGARGRGGRGTGSAAGTGRGDPVRRGRSPPSPEEQPVGESRWILENGPLQVSDHVVGCHSPRGQPEVDNRLGRRPFLRSCGRGRPCRGRPEPAPGQASAEAPPGSSRPTGDGSPLPSACEYALRTRRSETRPPALPAGASVVRVRDRS
ncbi:hypothetical protein Bbelb_371400 [Branchiostoma belcheri]|nr:hypothetical protein Bbelb_371400 [Branchiostoma belcheri]